MFIFVEKKFMVKTPVEESSMDDLLKRTNEIMAKLKKEIQ